MPIDYSKFNNIEDSDDEVDKKKNQSPKAKKDEASVEKGAPASAPNPIVLKEHSTPLDDAPDMVLGNKEWTTYYTEKMTAPQRMQTLVHLWNSADQTERVEFLRHLIDIIHNPTVSNRIKGGQEILKDLDTSFYQGVTYPEKWVDDFKEKLSIEEKKTVFEKLFKSLDNQERGMVIATLM